MLRAEGNVFTGGADVHGFDGPRHRRPTPATSMGGLEADPAHRGPADPDAVGVHALCLTAGFELSLACDMIWAAESAQFGLVEAVVGLTPGWGGTQRLAERAGPARAREFVMSAAASTTPPRSSAGTSSTACCRDDELLPKATRVRPEARERADACARRHQGDRARRSSTAACGRPTAARPEIVGSLFETEDLQSAVKSFLARGAREGDVQGTLSRSARIKAAPTRTRSDRAPSSRQGCSPSRSGSDRRDARADPAPHARAGRAALGAGAERGARPADEPDRLGPRPHRELRGAVARAARSADGGRCRRSWARVYDPFTAPRRERGELPYLRSEDCLAYMERRARAHARLPRAGGLSRARGPPARRRLRLRPDRCGTSSSTPRRSSRRSRS